MGEIARDRESEARAAVLAVGGAVSLTEGLEDGLVLLGRNADARVLHLEGDPRAHAAHTQSDPAALGELERVREQVLHHLLQAHGIGNDRRGRVSLDGHRQIDALFVRHGAEHVAQLVDQARDGDLSSGRTSSLPASIFDRSRMSLMSVSRSLLAE